jgi:hypothetical protein
MQNNFFANVQATPDGLPAGQPVRDTIYYICRIVTALAWTAIFVWVFAPKGSGWADAAGNAGLAWILLTGGGYFADSTLRSIVKLYGRGETK